MTKFFHRDGSDLVCDLCFRHCRIQKGKRGFCGTQKRDGDELLTTVAGHPSALNIDPIEKKPLYHFLPGSDILSVGTVGCNLRCPFCQNNSLVLGKEVPSRSISAEEITVHAAERKIPSIAFTYNEPTVFWPWAREIASLAQVLGIKTVAVSNGDMSEMVAEDMAALIDAMNIDLKCGSGKVYRELLKGDLERVLDNVELFVSRGVWVELTTLIVPGVSDNLQELAELAENIKRRCGTTVPWHLSAFHPAADYYDRKPTEISEIEKGGKVLNESGFQFIYSGNVAVENDTPCPDCGEILISRNIYTTEIKNLSSGICGNCGRKLEGVFQ